MSKEFKRTDRVSQLMQRELSLIIQQEVKDPRLPKFITISEVSLSPDLSSAKIYITIFDSEDKQRVTVEILNKASSFLRMMLGQKVKLRFVPHLKFIYDNSIEHGNNLRRLIDEVAPNDEINEEE